MLSRAGRIGLPLLCIALSVMLREAHAETCPDVVEPKLRQRFEAALAKKNAEARPIYGCDDRRNYYDPAVSEHERKAARATAVLVPNVQLRSADAGQTTWDLQPRAGAEKLCSPEQAVAQGSTAPERFFDEPPIGYCSAFKVGKRLMATAGHCIKNKQQCDSFGIVFGFHMTKEDDTPGRAVSASRIYRCVRVVAAKKTEDSDWSIFEVDRDIDAPQVEIRTRSTTPPLKSGTALTVVGYPLGLPVKIAGGADVSEIRKAYFTANLDTYHVNSGSAVFNSDSLKQGQLLVEGILVRGENDFAPGNSSCVVSQKCPADGCRKEDVTLTSEFARVLKK